MTLTKFKHSCLCKPFKGIILVRCWFAASSSHLLCQFDGPLEFFGFKVKCSLGLLSLNHFSVSGDSDKMTATSLWLLVSMVYLMLQQCTEASRVQAAVSFLWVKLVISFTDSTLLKKFRVSLRNSRAGADPLLWACLQP